jgi:hypothetical protein
MKTTLLTAAIALLVAAVPAAAPAKTFSIDVTVTRRQAPTEPVANLEISLSQHGTAITQVTPATTDASGKCTLRFDSDERKPQVKFFVTGQNPHLQEAWYVYRHGFYEPPDQDGPFTVQSVPDRISLDAFPETEYRLVIREAILNDGNTAILSSAIASAVIMPTSGADINLQPDPTQLRATLQNRYQFSPAETDQLLTKWGDLVTAAPADEKLDEKALLAITQKDLVKANALALQADALSGADKAARLSVLPDTGRLLTSVGRLTQAQVQRPDTTLPANIRQRLNQDIQLIRPRVPDPALMAAPIPPAQMERLRPFAEGAAERAAAPR